jgi:hypothetical protein
LELNRKTKFKAINEQSNHNIMHPNGFGETNRFASQSLNARAQSQMLALNFLGIALAYCICNLRSTKLS